MTTGVLAAMIALLTLFPPLGRIAPLERVAWAIVLASFIWSAFRSWQVQYHRADSTATVLTSVAGASILRWLEARTKSTTQFAIADVADALDLPTELIVAALERLESRNRVAHVMDDVWRYPAPSRGVKPFGADPERYTPRY